jgi:signal transduction histidine kinase/CheY-like chemotaxis protein
LEPTALARFAEVCPHPVLRVTRAGAILDANPAGRELVGQWLDPDHLPPALQQQLTAALVEERTEGLLMGGRGLPPFDLLLDGEHVWLQGRGSNDQVAEQVRAAQRTKAAFLANMSHELRTPLNAILGYTELLTEEARETARGDMLPDLDRVHSAATHLLRLINDILDVSKIEAGRVGLFLETFNVLELVREVVSTVQPMVERNRNRLRLEVELEHAEMRADRTKLRQLLFNLLDNACKFTEEGEIVVSVESLTSGGSPTLAITVEDTGIGMSESQLAQLYEPFSQADPSTTRRHGGTGLGLALCQLLANLMDGDIQVYSSLGEGTTFRVIVPATIDAPLDDAGAMGVTVKGEGSTTVLVIDDDPVVRDLLSRFLLKEGYRVVLAPDGEVGFQAARRERPDAITLDVMMPRLDGWDVLKRLKSDPVTAEIPVVMCSIVDNTGLGFALGASDYLTKPIDRGALTEALSRYRKGQGQLLLVDDSADVRDVVARTLRRVGWEVAEAADGGEALAWLESNRPDVVLLDLLMPGIDGFELVDRMQADERLADIPVMVVTAKDLTPADEARLRGGVERVLAKSGRSLLQLSEELRSLLPGGSATQ